jgi:Putative Actinobacterial Holin-X, holin superfamily III
VDTRSIPRADRGDPVVPLGVLLGDVAGHTQAIVRTEVRLAVAEARAELADGARRVSLLGAAGVLAMIGVVMALVAGILALSTILAAWVAVLIAAGLTLLLSIVLLGAARGASTRPTPRSPIRNAAHAVINR